MPSGVCGQSEQDPAHPRHPAEEPDQTHRVPQQVPERPRRGRAVQRREDLSNQTDPRPQEANPAGRLKADECLKVHRGRLDSVLDYVWAMFGSLGR